MLGIEKRKSWLDRESSKKRIVMATARKTIHARPRHLGKIHNRPRFDGVFDAVTITVYYWKNYQAYLVLIYDKIIRNLKFHANLHDFFHTIPIPIFKLLFLILIVNSPLIAGLAH